MKKNELKEIKSLEVKELLSKVNKTRQELIELKLDQKQKDKKAFFKKRKDIAQMLTILRQKQQIEELKVKSESKRLEKI